MCIGGLWVCQAECGGFFAMGALTLTKGYTRTPKTHVCSCMCVSCVVVSQGFYTVVCVLIVYTLYICDGRKIMIIINIKVVEETKKKKESGY